jgi:hypothetical protein
MDRPIYASIFVDDPPANATYWARIQQLAMGFTPSETGWGKNWRNLECAPRFRVEDVQAFADFVEEFGIRGKFTILPCPAGHGRIDRSVRGYSNDELRAILDLMRGRIAPHFDITPEVLTHSMAFDPETEALLPHSESAWISHLASTGQHEKLAAYIRFGYDVLRNAGFRPHGLTVGGMIDCSGIAKGQMVLDGTFPLTSLGETLLRVEQEYNAAIRETFLWTGSPPITQTSRERMVPDVRYSHPEKGRVFAVHGIDDPAQVTMHGDCDVDAETDNLISPDLERGQLITHAEAGKVLAIVLHTQTLNSRNTGHGQKMMREVCRRLRERYGKRLQWKTSAELCAELGVES